ncbi:MAG TPA: class I SAM-dependent methyltransferase [Longimicrobiaceae bacterium]|nr:class I SAM-dependent methyltransferase [Longimicrobiaceae bacterium]
MQAISCPACGSAKYRVFSTRGRNRIVVCVGCRLFYVNPIPERGALNARVEGSELYTEDQLRKVEFFRRRAEALFTRVESRIGVGRVLDVGCAIGTGLVVARERGWEGVGIELSQGSVRIALEAGLDVRSVPMEESDFPGGYFDLVTLNHVLEHVPHVESFLGEVRRVLSPDGLLFVAVPNVNAWLRFLRGERYAWTFQDDHFLHFSPRTLRRLLRRCGFRTLEIETSRWRDFHQPVETRSLPFRTVNRVVEMLGMGVEIFCLARPADVA